MKTLRISNFLKIVFILGIVSGCAKNGSTLIPVDESAPGGESSPLVTLTSPADGTHLNATTVAITGGCVSGAGDVSITGTGLQSPVTATCSDGSFSTSISLTLTGGTKDFTLSQTNSAGTSSNSYSLIRDCPENYVVIPADSTVGTSKFCLAKYEMKLKTNAGTEVFDGYNGNVALDITQYVPDSRPNGIPWIQISQSDAILECATLGTGYHLVTAKEWAAMARNVESFAPNWSSGSAGTGTLVRGHSDGSTSASAVADGFAVAGSSLLSAGTGSDAYAGTGNTSSEAWSSGKEQRRTFTLTNSELIWDISGNAQEFNDVDGLGSTISYTGDGVAGYFDVFSTVATNFLASISISGGGTFDPKWIQPDMLGLNHAGNSTGQFYIDANAQVGKIITRGGDFATASKSGIFAADFANANTYKGSSAGFRCAVPAP